MPGYNRTRVPVKERDGWNGQRRGVGGWYKRKVAGNRRWERKQRKEEGKGSNEKKSIQYII